MVIIAIFGGLGNQMFQYALARSLQIKGKDVRIDTTLVMDRTYRKDFTYRNFELDKFSIKCKKAKKREVHKYVPNLWGNTPKLYKKMYGLKRFLFKRKLYLETFPYRYDPEIFELQNAYLMGYFQNERYFIDCRKELLEDFIPVEEFSEEAEFILSKIQNVDYSCSIHIRRGDYVTNAQVNQKHGVCSVEYYQRAINLLEQRNNKLIYFVFSDDSDWVKKCAIFQSSKFVIIDNKNHPDYEDLLLMSKCDYQIIANSTFSWWAAWLNTNPEKIVVVPSLWFRESADNEQVKALIPEEWIRI